MNGESYEEEIRSHLAGFPTRAREVEEMKREWREFKTRALIILLGAIVAMVGYGVWVGTINTNSQSNSHQIELIQVHIAEVDRRQQSADVTSAEIRTKLISIEATLVEIKQTLVKGR